MHLLFITAMMQFIMSHWNNSAEKFFIDERKSKQKKMKREKQGTWAAAHCVNHVSCVLYYPFPKIMSVTHDTTVWHRYFTTSKQQQKHRIIEKTWSRHQIADTLITWKTLRNECSSLPSITNSGVPSNRSTASFFTHQPFQVSNYIHVKLVFTSEAELHAKNDCYIKHVKLVPQRSSFTDISVFFSFFTRYMVYFETWECIVVAASTALIDNWMKHRGK